MNVFFLTEKEVANEKTEVIYIIQFKKDVSISNQLFIDPTLPIQSIVLVSSIKVNIPQLL